MKTFNKELQQEVTPATALEILKDGNNRLVENRRENRNLLDQVSETGSGQYPSAVVLTCIDSRTSAEIIFDQGVGDIFCARVAGNIVNEDILGSMEFACKVAGSKFIMVLGHTKCGAVKGACDHVQLGNLSTLLAKIEPAVQAETATTENRSSSNSTFVENVSRINVERTVQEILDRSSILKEMVEQGQIGIGGGMYDVTTGKVEFYDHTIQIK